VLVLVGGTIPKPDIEQLKAQGVAEVFTPGAPMSEIVDFLTSHVPIEA
jgi:methylmalonyl-CoA mutase C-terminal domain/subunit